MRVLKKLLRVLPLAAIAVPLVAQANGDPVTICVDDQPFAPYTFPNKDGTMQVLIKMAAAQSGMNVVFKVSPWSTCKENVKSGTFNAITAAGFNDKNRTIAEFPMKKDKADPAHSLGSARTLVLRLKGKTADWNGTKFSNVKMPILVPSDNATLIEKLKSLGVQSNDETKTLWKNFAKLVAGQGELVIGYENDALKQLATNNYADKIEALPEPFTETHYYLGFSKQYYEKNKEAVENLWNAIGKVKSSPEYKAAIKNIE